MLFFVAQSNPLSSVWQGLLDIIAGGLSLLQGAFEPVFGAHSWGWAIIGLTVVIRVLLLPLAIKQTRSMRAMQALQPKIRAIQKKYKTSREDLRRDPTGYRQRKQKMNEEVMALYREHGANPAAGCLPLVLQAPIFFALFVVLRDDPHLTDAPFYVFSPLSEAANADVWGWVLIVLMAGTMFYTQRQMMARMPRAEGTQAQQQKLMQYAMPVFLALFAQGLPIGVLVYWVTTNLWQLGQQALIIREVQAHPGQVAAGVETSPNGQVRESKGVPEARRAEVKKSGSKKGSSKKVSPKKPGAKKPGAKNTSRPSASDSRSGKEGHLPSRPRGSKGKRSR
ncbi:MAG: YidC/Oxa1 family membrane protein insertase [Actinomycetota bacterium]|nr:YidC/Oxa1 family membrane protein insertase [Actinomycetota bacterium]